ncbi:hypothetical protein S7335_479 [Synechococcus sp. PCC 7335]|nr:hypothetical protein S7335_479 [Synechococcus sp. PCC 7335]
MVLRTIFTQLVPTRGRQKKPNAAKKSKKGSATARRKKFNQL